MINGITYLLQNETYTAIVTSKENGPLHHTANKKH